MTAQRPFTMLAAAIFLIVALVHAIRLVTHFQVVLGSHVLPQWLSIAGMIIAGVLAVMLLREARR